MPSLGNEAASEFGDPVGRRGESADKEPEPDVEIEDGVEVVLEDEEQLINDSLFRVNVEDTSKPWRRSDVSPGHVYPSYRFNKIVNGMMTMITSINAHKTSVFFRSLHSCLNSTHLNDSENMKTSRNQSIKLVSGMPSGRVG